MGLDGRVPFYEEVEVCKRTPNPYSLELPVRSRFGSTYDSLLESVVRKW